MDDPKNFCRIIPTNFPAAVQQYAKQLIDWLYEVDEFRQRLLVDERLDTLLWSWPIRRALSAKPPQPLWEILHTKDIERRECKINAMARLKRLADDWYPISPPRSITLVGHRGFQRYADLYNELIQIGEACIPPEQINHAPSHIARLIEDHWGDPSDHQFEMRRDLQNYVLKNVPSKLWPRLCEMGEEARDKAFLYVRVTRQLDELRNIADILPSFIKWLEKAPRYKDYVEQDLGPTAPHPDGHPLPVQHLNFHNEITDCHDAFQTIVRTRSAVLTVLRNRHEEFKQDKYRGRDRRPSRGYTLGPWIAECDDALRGLDLPKQDRLKLQMAWGIRMPERYTDRVVDQNN